MIHRIRLRLLLLLMFSICQLTPASGQSSGKSWVGIGIGFLDPMSSAQYGMPMGAVAVGQVVPGGPAEKAGLRPGDLITSVDGVAMTSPNLVSAALGSHTPGDRIRVGIIHPMQGKNLSLEIIVVAGSTPSGGAVQPAQQMGGGQNGGQQMGAPQTGGAPRGGGAMPITAAQQTHMVQQGPCRAALPQGWQLNPGPNGQTADVFGPEGAYAGWGIAGINPAMQANYGAIYGPPETHIGGMLQLILHQPVQLGPAQNIGYYTVHQFNAGAQQGVALYHVYPAPMGQYISSDYFAYGPLQNPQLIAEAEAIMTSLQCTSSLRPPADGYATYEPPKSGGARKSSGSPESDSLKDYNSILGTQYAHDSAGNNYLLDRTSQWRDTGPDGAGYYKGSGVNMEKLTPGLE